MTSQTATTAAQPLEVRDEAVEVWNRRITMRVKVAGAGEPLLYLHAAAGLVWDPFLSRLAEHYTVYAPEFPGSSPGDPYAIHQIDELSDLVLAYEELVRKLGLARPVIVGPSFGGMLAAELAAAYPLLAERLILLDPVGIRRADLPIANPYSAPAEALPRMLFHDPGSPAAQAMFALPDDPDQAAAITATMIWTLGCTGKFVWPVIDTGLRKRLHRIGAPTLIVWGRQDAIVPVGYADEFASLIPDAEVAVVEDCGHVPQVEQLEPTFEAVRRFLQR
jgi:pimeloyl-ACP methyl ester carboxylesterase